MRVTRFRAGLAGTACNLFTFDGNKLRSYTVLNNTAAFAEGLMKLPLPVGPAI